jgi:hypothetical protein
MYPKCHPLLASSKNEWSLLDSSKNEWLGHFDAAAHFHSAHFHPRKRGDIGGGDDPPMDCLEPMSLLLQYEADLFAQHTVCPPVLCLGDLYAD